eukprot:TRINITY_DN2453_c0_g3_i4.p1 TRINITY_DN2453_c0_g3~~TRINITY_DN2453_c0_g3_i4.p1  ORF type:complete len:430 (+),score=81.76 TRINITY_DN2453_c0_g3_i4:690-1979(+)
MISNFHQEMDLGLDGSAGSTLKMIPSFVGKSSGNEKGQFIALDLGGTNFRVLLVKLDGLGRIGEVKSEKYEIPKQKMESTADELFDFLAEKVADFYYNKIPQGTEASELGFTFSFPVEQTSINKGLLIRWTKGFKAKGTVGEDVVRLLTDAFDRKNVSLHVTALVNDTVGTLMTRSYSDNQCEIGVILGTGSNACYVEQTSNITKLESSTNFGDNMIINIEWGAFGDGKNILKFSPIDIELDRQSIHPGQQQFEKMISGMYLGEIVRLIVLYLAKHQAIFLNVSLTQWKKSYFLDSAFVSKTEEDKSSDLSAISKLLSDTGIEQSTLQERQLLQDICETVSTRASTLSAMAILAVASKIGKLNCSVAIDGSLFSKHPDFKTRMEKTIAMINENANLKLVETTDGSGLGAAIIAAVSSTKKAAWSHLPVD